MTDAKIDLWFFRELSDDQRLALFSIFGLPVDEIGRSHGHQRKALNRCLPAPAATVVAESVAVPEGWKLVPVEPTAVMGLAGRRAHESSSRILQSKVLLSYCAMIAAAPAAPIKAKPVAWCQPMDCGEHRPRRFIVYFEDADRGMAVFEDEAEAREFYEKAKINWNCYLFGALPAAPTGEGA